MTVTTKENTMGSFSKQQRVFAFDEGKGQSHVNPRNPSFHHSQGNPGRSDQNIYDELAVKLTCHYKSCGNVDHILLNIKYSLALGYRPVLPQVLMDLDSYLQPHNEALVTSDCDLWFCFVVLFKIVSYISVVEEMKTVSCISHSTNQ